MMRSVQLRSRGWAAVGALLLLGVACFAGLPARAAFVPGHADPGNCISFDPFTLTTAAVPTGQLPTVQLSVPAPVPGVLSFSSGIVALGDGYIPAPRIPCRLPLRSPYRPGL